MGEATIGQKISWFLYQKGLGTAKPDFLFMARVGGPEWFRVAETLYEDRNMKGRAVVLEQLLQAHHFRPGPRRSEYLGMMGFYLSKGVLDERRRIVRYVHDNPELFQDQDDQLMGPLITAQRDSDPTTANTAEEALLKIRGEVQQSKEDFR